MLNIRINLTINLKKVVSILGVLLITSSQMLQPAYAVKEFSKTVLPPEKAITVSLTHLKVTTTQSAARKALASPHAKYFDAEATAFLTVYTQDWSVKEWNCLRYIWTKESHFNPKAENKSSGAYGIAQFMPSTWGNYKVVKTEDAQLQIKYGLRYILKRYGNAVDPNGACNAQAFWKKNNWY